VDRVAQALVQHVRVADSGGRVGVELEEAHVVAGEEGVEAADAKRAVIAWIHPDEGILERRQVELAAQQLVVGVRVAEAVQHPAEHLDRSLDASHLAR
jgi:hypothetical protein